MNERGTPTDTLTGVDGQMVELGDTAAGLWNEYGWSLLASEGQTDRRTLTGKGGLMRMWKWV